MQKETVTFDKLPEAVGYLTEQVIELKKMVAELQPQPSNKHVCKYSLKSGPFAH